MNLLLAAVLLLQDKTAEETFKKIEETVENAKTVSAKVFVKVTSPMEGDPPLSSTISIFLKNDNKVRLDMVLGSGDNERRSNIVSDGSSLRVRFGEGNDYDKETPAAMRSLWNRTLVRTGVMVGSFFLQDSIGEGKTPDLKTYLSVSDVKQGDDDGLAKTLTFSVIIYRKDTADIRLWYDPKTFKLQKRTILPKTNAAPTMGAISETYDDLTLDADIPDEKFKIPEEKK